MEDEEQLAVKSDVLGALAVVPAEGASPTPELALAAILHRLAVDKGLAPPEDPERSVVRTAGLPAAATALLDHCFGADGAPASDDDVRNGLHDALMTLSTRAGALRAMHKTKPLTSEELLRFAQIYWNLDAEGERTGLPIRAGQMRPNGKAYIKVDGTDEDYAELTLKQRANRTPGYARSAGAFYERGARLASLVARLLIERSSVSVQGATLRATQTGRGAEWAIVWQVTPTDVAPSASTKEAKRAPTRPTDPMADPLQDLRQTSLAEGRLSDAALLSTTLIRLYLRRSEVSPGDHESQLAGAYLDAGLADALRGEVEKSLEYFANAERASHTLTELRPSVRGHRVRVAIARAMMGTLLSQVGRVEEAEDALSGAVALAQSLTDENSGDEDMLAAALSMAGALYLQTNRPQQALPALSRALTIAQKIANRDPDDAANQLQLANTLTSVGMLHFQMDSARDAEEALVRSVGISEGLTSTALGAQTTGLLIAGSQFLLGALYFNSDRYEEAEASLVDVISRVGTFGELGGEASHGLLLVSAQHMLGLVYAMTDRDEEAVASLTHAAERARALTEAVEPGRVGSAQSTRATTFLGGAFYFLGLLHLERERENEAESSLCQAIDVFRSPPFEPSDQAMLADAVDLLADLYQRQGRVAEAGRLLELATQPDDPNPDAAPIV